LSTATGAVIYAYYAVEGCDPLASGKLNNVNQLTPHFATEVLNYPGIPGLFMASIFSASLSTVSSTQNALSAIIWEDLLKGKCSFRDVSSVTETLILKGLVVSTGVVILGFSFLAHMVGGTLWKIIVLMTSTPHNILAGMMLSGALCSRTSAGSTIISGISMLAVLTWISLGSLFIENRHPVLPTITDNCTVPMNGTTGKLLPVSEFTGSTNVTSSLDAAAGAEEWSLVNWLYSLSFLFLPIAGFILTILLSVLLSFIPCLHHKEYVPDKYLLWVVRGWRNGKEKSREEVLHGRMDYPYHKAEQDSFDDIFNGEKRKSTVL